MTAIRILVGTRKGAFILSSDGKRKKWSIDGPHFAGWEIYHVNGSAVDPNRIFASQTSSWFGQIIQRSDDGGKTWTQPGSDGKEEQPGPGGMPRGESNRFVYDTSEATGKPLTTHQWYDGTQHPWEFARVWHLEPSLDDTGHLVRRCRGRGLVPHDRRRRDLAGDWRACAVTNRVPAGRPAPADMCLHTIVLDPSNAETHLLCDFGGRRVSLRRRRRYVETDQPGSALGIHSRTRPRKSGTAYIASRYTRATRTSCSCKSTGTSCAATTAAIRGVK